jgi:hypothetical protein
MLFNKLFNETLQQLEFNFKDIPAWAKALNKDWDTLFKAKYYSIKNIKNERKRNASFRKFWPQVISALKDRGYTKYKIIDLGVPEYAFYTNV